MSTVTAPQKVANSRNRSATLVLNPAPPGADIRITAQSGLPAAEASMKSDAETVYPNAVTDHVHHAPANGGAMARAASISHPNAYTAVSMYVSTMASRARRIM